MADNGKGRVCVTGGSSYIGSWIIKNLLERGYSVNTTTRIDPEHKRDLSYLTNLEGAKDRLKIFHADLNEPDSFTPAIEGCIGVFHVAHPMKNSEEESEEVKEARVTAAMKGILKACADSKTVKRIVHTSSTVAIVLGQNGSDVIDESTWTDVEQARSMKHASASYIVTKTITEKLALDLARELGLDLVSVCPTLETGPFMGPRLPDTVKLSLALINGNERILPYISDTNLIHVEDVARAHIHLFEYPEAKGRYICTGLDVPVEEIAELIPRIFPEYQLRVQESLKSVSKNKSSPPRPRLSNDKLLQTGFKNGHGLEDMIVGAVESCKTNGFI